VYSCNLQLISCSIALYCIIIIITTIIIIIIITIITVITVTRSVYVMLPSLRWIKIFNYACIFVYFVCAEDDIWICKPTGKNQGKGIFLVRSELDLQQADAEQDETSGQNPKQKKTTKPMSRIIQRWAMPRNWSVSISIDCASEEALPLIRGMLH